MYGLLVLSCAIAAPGDLTLARGGASPYTIVVAPDAPAADQTAARELQTTLAEVTGVTLPLAAAPPAGQPAVVVGEFSPKRQAQHAAVQIRRRDFQPQRGAVRNHADVVTPVLGTVGEIAVQHARSWGGERRSVYWPPRHAPP